MMSGYMCGYFRRFFDCLLFLWLVWVVGHLELTLRGVTVAPKWRYNDKIPPHLTVWGELMSFAEDLIILKWILEHHFSCNIYLLNTFSELPVLHLLLIYDATHTTKPRCCNGAATLILWTLSKTSRNWLFPVGKFRREEHRKHGDADRKWDELQWQKQVEVKWMMSCC